MDNITVLKDGLMIMFIVFQVLCHIIPALCV